MTELLVAIGLLAIIMLSVSTVFRATGETVSVGLATIEMNRRLLTAQTTLKGDISGFGADPFEVGHGMWAVNANPANFTNPPFLIIRNHAQLGFFDRKEWVAAGSPAVPLNIPENVYRTDTFGFFARGIYKRQTGGNRIGASVNDAWPLMNNMWGLTNAYMWYGHLRLPNNAQALGAYDPVEGNTPGLGYYSPGANDPTFNPNNYFASQWILGRTQISLVQPVAHPTNALAYPDFVPDLYQNPIYYYGRDILALPTTLTPLSNGQATCGDGASNGAEVVWESRYDIAGLRAGVSWSDYADIVNTFRFAGTGVPTPNVDWVEDRFSTRFRANPFAIGEIDWTMASGPNTFSARSAQQVPVFMPGCTQFIVEFAGDFVLQQANGSVAGGDQVALDPTAPGTFHLDGVTDFDIVRVNGQDVRRIHWYGFPRRTDGSVGTVRVPTPNNLASGDVTTVTQMRDQTDTPAALLMPFEFWPGSNDTYDCGWTKDMLFMPDGANPKTLAPQMIRITIQVSDTEGRVRDGMTRQFVFPVKRI